MVLPIDTSKAFLGSVRLAALVQAVCGADDHDEHDWIEWKSVLDLTATNTKTHIAKQVLGFSNRTVATAARNAGGYAYMIVGAEPGTLTGITTIDNANLSNAIAKYVGGVRWSPEYVVVEGKTVLVVVTDPPKPGDSPFTLQRGFGNHQPGAIFVRVPGKSEQATPAQVKALVERARATRATLELAVRADPPTIEASPDPDTARLAEIIAAERALLIKPPPSKPAEPRRFTSQPRTNGAEQYRALAAAAAAGAFSSSLQHLMSDPRTEADYADEVEKYLQRLRLSLLARLLDRRRKHPACALQLAIDNPTDRNFMHVVVTVHIAGEIRGWTRDETRRLNKRQDLPLRPRPFGTRPPNDLVGLSGLVMPAVSRSMIMPQAVAVPGFSIENSGSVTITYDPVNVRPQTPTRLPTVALIVNEPVATTLAIEWRATANNVDGLRSGTTAVTVAAATLDFEPPGAS